MYFKEFFVKLILRNFQHNKRTLINHHVKKFYLISRHQKKSSLKLMVKFLFFVNRSRKAIVWVFYGIAAVIKILRFKQNNSPSHKISQYMNFCFPYDWIFFHHFISSV